MRNVAHSPMMLTVALISLICTELHAQGLTLRLVVAPQVPPQISQWSSERESIKALVTNSGDVVTARFEAELYHDGALVAETQFGDMPIVKIPSGVSTWPADVIIPVTALTFKGSMSGHDSLKIGPYELSIRLCSGGIEMGLCMFTKQMIFVGGGVTPPMLWSPADHAVIEQNTPALFSWSAVTGATPMHYRIQLYEVPAGSSAENAVLNSNPVFQTEDTSTQINLIPSGLKWKPGMQYAWLIKAMTAADDSSGSAVSLVNTFQVKQ